jgi:nucleoside 2-deoxyribosyltransferase
MPAFISHSQKDSGMFSALRAGLTGQGIPTWDPASMGAGGSLREQLREAINNCDVCVFLATKSSVDSAWCMAEIGAFWGADKHVIVYMADPTIDETQLPPQLKGDLWTNNFDRLVRDVQKIILEADERRK